MFRHNTLKLLKSISLTPHLTSLTKENKSYIKLRLRVKLSGTSNVQKVVCNCIVRWQACKGTALERHRHGPDSCRNEQCIPWRELKHKTL